MKCSKCGSDNVQWISNMDDFEEGALCWFICEECTHMFMDIEIKGENK